MEGSVEAGDLRDIRQPGEHGFDARKAEGLVKGREGSQPVQFVEYNPVDGD